MLFNSYGFVFAFFPLVLAGYYICQKKSFLLAASLIFYGCLHPEYLPVLLGSMAAGYGFCRQLERTKRKKLVLAAGLIFHLAVLFCFKYLGSDEFIPLGISFFTFTQIAFLMECYRGNLGQVKALSYGLYVSFFPKMIQGPIALPGEMLPQFEKVKRPVDAECIYRNLSLFVLGLFKKVLIADTLGKAADFGYANLAALNSGDGIIVMLSYTLQLYFDFGGYCDMAMGVAGMLGIELPLNFNSPYKSSNIIEFWKGWHITLTRFFTKYLYIPLGGSRKGKGRTYLNCLIVFFLSGIWHGAGWQFIVWGMMHGVLYVLTRAWKDTIGPKWVSMSTKKEEAGAFVRVVSRFGHTVCVILTFLYVNVAWIFFRAPSVKEAVSLIKTICSFHFGRINWDLAGCFNLDEFWYVIKVFKLDRWQYANYILMVLILAATLLLVFFGENAVSFVRKIKPNAIHVIFMVILFVWSVVSFSGVSSFLYVNF